jgi:predicted transposase/invertase (TIGR01784 family)
MTQISPDKSVAQVFPAFPSHRAAKQYIASYPSVWEDFLNLPPAMQQELLDFCTGRSGLRITYDPVFRRIFQPELHQDRLESLLSAILQRHVSIVKVLPREGTHLTEKGSFVIMDILVQLDDGSYANVEMQKIGYNFPLARADCYASDIIMRQYEQAKAELKDNFSFSKLQKVYCIILMEKSPSAFHEADRYIHTRTASFDTGIYQGRAGLHEDIFICLDTFQAIVHTVNKGSSMQEAWLTFLSSTNASAISALVTEYPMFLPIYQEIADFAKKPEELMHMFSEALYIMDRNMERMMVEEYKTQLQESELKAEIFRLRLNGKTPEETAAELSVSIEKVNEILATV